MKLFETFDPYSYNRLYGDEKYSLQGMLLKQANFPRTYSERDELYDIWSDRVYSEWVAASDELIVTKATGDAYYAEATDASFLAFASKLFSTINNKEITLTGAALVRNTNGGGYPCLYLMGIVMSDEPRPMGYPTSTPKRNLRYEDEMMMRYGRENY